MGCVRFTVFIVVFSRFYLRRPPPPPLRAPLEPPKLRLLPELCQDWALWCCWLPRERAWACASMLGLFWLQLLEVVAVFWGVARGCEADVV